MDPYNDSNENMRNLTTSLLRIHRYCGIIAIPASPKPFCLTLRLLSRSLCLSCVVGPWALMMKEHILSGSSVTVTIAGPVMFVQINNGPYLGLCIF